MDRPSKERGRLDLFVKACTRDMLNSAENANIRRQFSIRICGIGQ